MKRRFFVKSTGIAATTAALSPGFANAANLNIKPAGNEFYEIRVYDLNNEKQQKLVEDYLENAAITAMNRYGIKHVGVFTELQPIGQTKILCLFPIVP